LLSATQRLPLASTDICHGVYIPDAVVADREVVNVDCPSTDVADWPLAPLAAFGKSRTRLLPLSEIQRFPLASPATPLGASRVVCEVPELQTLKLDCPMTKLAALPDTAVPALRNISTRLL
jgi:hypothetical protein